MSERSPARRFVVARAIPARPGGDSSGTIRALPAAIAPPVQAVGQATERTLERAPPVQAPPVSHTYVPRTRAGFPQIDAQGHQVSSGAESQASWVVRKTSFAVSLIANLCLLIGLAAWHIGEQPAPVQIELAVMPDLPPPEELIEIAQPEFLENDALAKFSAAGDLSSLPEAPEIAAITDPRPAVDPPGAEPLLDQDLFSSDLLQSMGGGSGGGSGGAGPGFGDGSLLEFVDRLQRAGAKSGDVQISLLWDNTNDLDLHVITPRGETIFFGHRRSRDRGLLDVDMNAGRRLTHEPVENIVWATGAAPLGKYKVYVHHYRNHGDPDPTRFEVRVIVDGETQVFHGEATFGERRTKVHEFTRLALGKGPASAATSSPNDDFPLMDRK